MRKTDIYTIYIIPQFFKRKLNNNCWWTLPHIHIYNFWIKI